MDNKVPEQIHSWLLEWLLFDAFEEFKETYKVECVDRDLLQGTIKFHSTRQDVNLQKKALLLVLLCKLTDGENFEIKYENMSNITVLEDVITLMPEVVDIEEYKYDSLMALLKEQAVYVCCRSNNFKVADEVFKRQWGKPGNASEKNLKGKVLSALKSKKSDFHLLKSKTYKDCCKEFANVMEPVNNDMPFLRKAAKCVLDKENIAGLSNIQIQGSLLKQIRKEFKVKDTQLPDASDLDKKIIDHAKNKGLHLKKQKMTQIDEDESNKEFPDLERSKTSTPRIKQRPEKERPQKEIRQSSDSDFDDIRPLPERLSGASVMKRKGVDLDLSMSFSESGSSDDEVRKKKVKQKQKKVQHDKDGFAEPSLLPPPPPPTSSMSHRAHRSNASMISTSSRRRVPWTRKETEYLYEGVKKYGVGCWAIIKNNTGNFPTRTAVQMKDRWRSMLNDKGLMKVLTAKFGQ